MSLTITQESPLTGDANRLIQGSQADLRSVYTADECFSFSARQLDLPEIRFFVARKDRAALGCVALCDCGSYAEVKRLFVTPEGRRLGLGRKLMSHLEAQAKFSGTAVIRLETGQKLAAAVALYKSIGYEARGPFGNYSAHAASLFMEKSLK
ncbi:MAG: GNAT family N-acetyltransferase [Halocynthiibacter sp.]